MRGSNSGGARKRCGALISGAPTCWPLRPCRKKTGSSSPIWQRLRPMSDMKHEALLRVEGLSGRRLKRPSDRVQPRELVFEGLSFSVAAGERLAVVAQPGEGKTALLRTVAMLQRPASGRVFFEGRDLVRLGGGELRRLRRRLQYVGGDPRYLLPLAQTVGQALLEPLQIHGLGTPVEQRSRTEAAANLLGVSRLLLD